MWPTSLCSMRINSSRCSDLESLTSILTVEFIVIVVVSNEDGGDWRCHLEYTNTEIHLFYLIAQPRCGSTLNETG